MNGDCVITHHDEQNPCAVLLTLPMFSQNIRWLFLCCTEMMYMKSSLAKEVTDDVFF